MEKYFAQVNFVIEADDEDAAEMLQQTVRALVGNLHYVVYATADEPVELDEFGNA